ncbi:MAG: winged helix-turn-helix domain-containing protein [Acidobacteria bacterium]|nr:winged helix-turn-helix domain-containing protein [Acidobacteriota bacterium]
MGGTRGAFRFGPFEIDGDERVLRKNGVKIHLQQQPLQVLLALLEAAGRMVTRQELCRGMWPEGTFVEFDDALNTAVKKIRAALCDDASGPRYVETIPRRGYRFLASVDRAGPAQQQNQRDLLVMGGRPSRFMLPTLVSLVAICFLPYVFREIVRFHAAHSVTLAILPLSSMNANSSRTSLSYELSQTLSEQLRRRSGAEVLDSRSHAEAARNLIVNTGTREIDYVLQGGILEEGTHVHVAVQLVRLSDQNYVWAGDFDADGRDSSTRAELAAKIVRQLEPTLDLMGTISR